MDTDDVSNSGDDGEVLESGGVQDDGSEFVLLSGGVQGAVDDLDGADEFVLGDLVGEGGINDNSIDVLVLFVVSGGDVGEGVVGVSLS